MTDRPESELQAEEVAFVNTCEKHAALLGVHATGRYKFSVSVYDVRGKLVNSFGTFDFNTEPEIAAIPLTMEEMAALVRPDEPLEKPAGAVFLEAIGKVAASLPTSDPPPKPRKGK